jgi:hypothetical protein
MCMYVNMCVCLGGKKLQKICGEIRTRIMSKGNFKENMAICGSWNIPLNVLV